MYNKIDQDGHKYILSKTIKKKYNKKDKADRKTKIVLTNKMIHIKHLLIEKNN